MITLLVLYKVIMFYLLRVNEVHPINYETLGLALPTQ